MKRTLNVIRKVMVDVAIRAVRYIKSNKCYIYRLLVGWFIWNVILNYSQWVVAILLDEVFRIKASKSDIFYFGSFTIVILMPEFLAQVLLLLWYIIGCKPYLRDKYGDIFRLFGLLFVFYWSYLSTFDFSKEIIGYLMSKHPYQTPFWIIFHSMHIFLFMFVLYLWEKFWDDR